MTVAEIDRAVESMTQFADGPGRRDLTPDSGLRFYHPGDGKVVDIALLP